MAYYYAKINISMLSDPAFIMLPESDQLLYMKLILVAKQNENDEDYPGLLPEINVVAFHLRKDVQTVERGLAQLANSGLAKIVMLDELGAKERWFLIKYSEMQEPSDAAKRQREYRKRKKEAKKEKDKELDIDLYRSVTGDVTAVTKRNGEDEPTIIKR